MSASLFVAGGARTLFSWVSFFLDRFAASAAATTAIGQTTVGAARADVAVVAAPPDAAPAVTSARGDFDAVAPPVSHPSFQAIQSSFWGDSARYRVTVVYAAAQRIDARIVMLTDDRPVAEWSAGEGTPLTRRGGAGRIWYERIIEPVELHPQSRVGLGYHRGLEEEKGFSIEEVTFTRIGTVERQTAGTAAHTRSPTLRVFETPSERTNARSMLRDFLEERENARWKSRERELSELTSPGEWRARQERTRTRLTEMMGKFGPKSPLNVRMVGRIDRPKYTIEKIVFESQPRYFCTANVYVPKRQQHPAPGILFLCGHSNEGKGAVLYHEACLGLVLKGYVVLALDPMGQGERYEYFDQVTGRPFGPVAQHHYLARPARLVGRTLVGRHCWDGVRALDYLVTRPEVDAERIGVLGNSGGGFMALMTAAVDPRIKVCAAGHPGGDCDQIFLNSEEIPEADIRSLIAPRPCLIIVGDASGEEVGRRRKMEWMCPFYRGLGVDEERLRWTGPDYTVRDVGSESGQTLNATLAETWRKIRPAPESRVAAEQMRDNLRVAISSRLGWGQQAKHKIPDVVACGKYDAAEFSAEKLRWRASPESGFPFCC